jgi:hypothetical protein
MEIYHIENNVDDFVYNNQSNDAKSLFKHYKQYKQYITKSQKRDEIIFNIIADNSENNIILLICDTISQMERYKCAIKNSRCIRMSQPSYIENITNDTNVFICLSLELRFIFDDFVEIAIKHKINICIDTSVGHQLINTIYNFILKTTCDKLLYIYDTDKLIGQLKYKHYIKKFGQSVSYSNTKQCNFKFDDIIVI